MQDYSISTANCRYCSLAQSHRYVDTPDGVIKWKHFPRYWPFVRGIHWSPVNSPHKGQWRRALVFSLICTWTNGRVNNRDAGDLRRHRAHYEATVMKENKTALCMVMTWHHYNCWPSAVIIESKFPIYAELISPWTKWPPFHRRLFKCIFLNEKFCILIQTSLKFVPKGPTGSKW